MTIELNWKNLVIITLLALHTLWITNHIRLVYEDRINPWRLGGYGMYTVPNPKANIVLLDMSNAAAPIKISNKNISFEGMSKATRLTNINRSFRCAHIPEAALTALVSENATLQNKNIVIFYVDFKFEKKSPWNVLRPQGQVEIKWLTPTIFSYQSKFCDDDPKTGVVSLQ